MLHPALSVHRIGLCGCLGSARLRACSEVWLSPEVSNLISWVRIPAGAPTTSIYVQFIYRAFVGRPGRHARRLGFF